MPRVLTNNSGLAYAIEDSLGVAGPAAAPAWFFA